MLPRHHVAHCFPAPSAKCNAGTGAGSPISTFVVRLGSSRRDDSRLHPSPVRPSTAIVLELGPGSCLFLHREERCAQRLLGKLDDRLGEPCPARGPAADDHALVPARHWERLSSTHPARTSRRPAICFASTAFPTTRKPSPRKVATCSSESMLGSSRVPADKGFSERIGAGIKPEPAARRSGARSPRWIAPGPPARTRRRRLPRAGRGGDTWVRCVGSSASGRDRGGGDTAHRSRS